ncbi:hypothetical protein COS31_03625 [Candidatus Roizmanbacteria bacterium CG02_land_8_20_14_3_00_36_15]|uniref:Uncharacterized protein n=2 Tax=Candidatus Roizmaniibacteriota TaxID=1752723 RepID=A0A2M8KMH3_9BACT|nr:MAG: hypothetical protein COS51_03835 [Candidatus Roizmanbacteria bacterium CG03_land_8_20_14_0_80_36_21]PIV37652.1 MAG: hypothetical protein COS31_03625 [Candidatus Roizmanbacteria bacterium CG02_land_8_20_14_3_00_36_15]PIY69935.1 MAG: hypothetical protein COY89_03725 [Candidatus Roizmanbacteria bacterium CG_4_10_14_0_8_um_filter_36_36]PJA53482.1 MAG: hypothetical protein CO166_01695 [Candidatus Roizmanbacteria bacterium CG_4_9_14_3_um_filter_36_11]PJC82183.1 MAG: hypothetical protein CO007
MEKTIIYSAYKLDQSEVDLLTRKFPFIDQSNLENVIDKTLIAGVVIYHHSQIIDLSLKGRLNNLEKKLYEIDR